MLITFDESKIVLSAKTIKVKNEFNSDSFDGWKDQSEFLSLTFLRYYIHLMYGLCERNTPFHVI
jgi:hypothetical protein